MRNKNVIQNKKKPIRNKSWFPLGKKKGILKKEWLDVVKSNIRISGVYARILYKTMPSVGLGRGWPSRRNLLLFLTQFPTSNFNYSDTT